MTESFIYPVSTLIAGLDAVECGPFVGAVVIAAVIPDPTRPVLWLADSKKLSEKRREALYEEITLCAITCWSVFRAKAFEINSINIYQPTMLAMQRAGADLPVVPDFMLVDGNRCPLLPMLARAVVKDDRRVAEISAASIIPKIIRAREMAALHLQFPKYGFAQHKGRVPDRLPSEKAGASGRGLASSIKLCAVA